MVFTPSPKELNKKVISNKKEFMKDELDLHQ